MSDLEVEFLGCGGWMDAHERRTQALRAISARKAAAKREAVERALVELCESGARQKLTFAAVARVAKVSRTYLYKTPELSEKIYELIAGQATSEEPGDESHPSGMSVRVSRWSGPRLAGLEAVNRDLHVRVAELEQLLGMCQAELAALREQHACCPGAPG